MANLDSWLGARWNKGHPEMSNGIQMKVTVNIMEEQLEQLVGWLSNRRA
jgi:hypothetical protein